MDVKEAIQEYMTVNGLTQRELASTIGIAETALSRMLKRKDIFNDKQHMKIAIRFHKLIPALRPHLESIFPDLEGVRWKR